MKHILFAKIGLAAFFLGICITEGHTQTINSADVDAFQVADQAGTRDAYQGYLDVFPNGVFSVVARERTRPALLADLLPRMAPEKPKRGKSAKEELDQVWQEAWDRVKASDTEAGYLEYLSIKVPVKRKRPGEFEALARYLELSEQQASSVPTNLSCATPEVYAKAVTSFEVAGSFPQSAIDEMTTGLILGYHVVSPSGRQLGFVISFASSNLFVESTYSRAMDISFSPARNRCMNAPSRVPFYLSFWVDEFGWLGIKDSRPTQAEPVGQLEADVGIQEVELPADQAILVDLPAVPADRDRIWQLQGRAKFPFKVNVFNENGKEQEVFTNNYFTGNSGCSAARLRVSAPNVVDEKGRVQAGAAYSGKIKLVLSTAYDGARIPGARSPKRLC